MISVIALTFITCFKIVINSRAGVAKRLRLDYDTLRQFRPDLVYLDSTGYGMVVNSSREASTASRAATSSVGVAQV